MPDLHLYMTDLDDLRIVASALDHGCTMIPDLHYELKHYVSINVISEYKEYRKRTRAFYLWADSFAQWPLELRRIQKDEKTTYYIYPRSGGPTIRFLTGGTFKENGSTFIRPGELGYYLTYENTLSGNDHIAPRSLVNKFKLLANEIKQTSAGVKLGRHSQFFWLGRDAVRAVRRGAKLVASRSLT